MGVSHGGVTRGQAATKPADRRQQPTVTFARDDTAITRATVTDADHVTRLIVAASRRLEPVRWLVRDDRQLTRVMLEFVRIWVEHSLFHGEVDLTGSGSAVAMWLPHDGRPLPEPAAYQQRVAALCGAAAGRFRTLDRLLLTHPPSRPHHRLAVLAVHPSRQRRGLGSNLLAYHHQRLDQRRLAAYVEVLGLNARDLLLRHGYLFQSAYVLEGALAYRMWRNPSGDLRGGGESERQPRGAPAAGDNLARCQ